MLKSRNKRELKRGKKGQLTIFIIIAIIIVASVIVYFAVKGKIKVGGIPAKFQPIEEYYLSCIEDYTKAGVAILGEQAGYIYLPEFVPGSEYMPTSSQLSFLGSPVPYWYYASGNNIVKEQVPTKKEMENQLEKYLEENLACDFSNFRQKGFVGDLGEIKADVSITENKVDVKINADLDIGFEEEKVRISEHKTTIDTKLGKFYDLAIKIYDYEKQNMFLENYGLDVLYNYAPVNNVELTCSPKVWLLDNVRKEIKEALEANTIMLKVKGNYYNIKDKRKEYFVVDFLSDEAVQFVYSREWPTKIETQDENGLLIAEPVGNQPGLGILGFCYVPYHFVYDLTYPVLIRIYDEKEIFQFPVSVIIQGNKPRNALPGTFIGEKEAEICRYKNADILVYTYNTNLEAVEADISFKCFNEICDIGKTKLEKGEAILREKFPQCVNGFVIAKADGYETKKEMVSTNEESSVNIILDKLYDVNVSLKLDGKETEELAIVYFESQDTIATIAYPEQKSVSLSEGLYNITVYIYKNSTVYIPGTKTQKCINTPRPGLLGVFGMTTEKCFDLTIPSQTLSNVLIGGGKTEQYITETELEKGKAEILIDSLPLPQSLEDLQKNYELLEDKTIYLDFK